MNSVPQDTTCMQLNTKYSQCISTLYYPNDVLGVNPYAWILPNPPETADCSAFSALEQAFINPPNPTVEAQLSQLGGYKGGGYYTAPVDEFYDFFATNIQPWSYCNVQREYCGYGHQFDPQQSSSFEYRPPGSSIELPTSWQNPPPPICRINSGRTCSLDGIPGVTPGDVADDDTEVACSAAPSRREVFALCLVGLVLLYVLLRIFIEAVETIGQWLFENGYG